MKRILSMLVVAAAASLLTSTPAFAQVDRSTLFGARGAVEVALRDCDRKGFDAAKQRLITLLDALIKQEPDLERRPELMHQRDAAKFRTFPDPCPPGTEVEAERPPTQAELWGDYFAISEERMFEQWNEPAPPAGGSRPRTKTPEPEPSSAPETDDSGDIFDNPDNAKAGVGLTPMDEPAKSPTKGDPLPVTGMQPPPAPPVETPPESGAGAAGLPPLETLPQLPRRKSDGTPDPPKGPNDVSPNPRPPGQVQEMPPAETPPAPTESTETMEPARQAAPPERRRKRDESPNPPKRPGDPSPNPTPDGL